VSRIKKFLKDYTKYKKYVTIKKKFLEKWVKPIIEAQKP